MLQEPPLEKACITTQHVNRAIALDKTFRENGKRFAPDGKPWFEIKRGYVDILLVAPHATHPKRANKMQFADRGTAPLAIILHELTGVSILYTTFAMTCDPNNDDDNAFKEALGSLLKELKPKLVLDLHASHEYRPFDVDFGTISGRSLLGKNKYLTKLASHFRNEGLLNLSKDYFSASKRTITRYCMENATPCIQLEINNAWLSLQESEVQNSHNFAKLLQALTRFIQNEGNIEKR